ncbi:MAG: hypothetical protein NC548_26245 [Lachnospiraceae bacterium]|nr:hypothetical protein [Lachnospiraceae bacterium]
MEILGIVQQKLDTLLLPDGVLSHHLRRVKVEKINGTKTPVNNDEYVVYRLVSTRRGTFGDGNAQLVRQYVDINYYYSYEKTDARYKDAAKRIKAIISAFLSDPRFRLANGENDIYDSDNPYRGINVEFLFVGVIENGKNG